MHGKQEPPTLRVTTYALCHFRNETKTFSRYGGGAFSSTSAICAFAREFWKAKLRMRSASDCASRRAMIRGAAV
jgi:hypothetical protein